MTCKEARKLMSPYLDSELGQTKTFEISEHLRQCPECAVRFARERHVDDVMRTCLDPPAMPEELWSHIRGELATPSWIRRLGTRNGLALAACLAIAFIGTTIFWQQQGSRERPWIVRHIVAEAPDDHPFQAFPPGQPAVERLLRDEYRIQLAMSPTVKATEHYDLQLISVTKRTDDRGREYVELRLNCCGHPVVVALARADGDLAAPFDVVSAKDVPLPRTVDGVHLAAKRIDDVVAVAASRHPVDHVLGSIRLVET